MKKIWEWAKEHKRLSIALAAGLIILIWIYARRAKSASPAAGSNSQNPQFGGLSEQGYLSLQESQLNASAALQAQQNQLAVTQQQSSDALTAQEQQYAAQVEIAKLNSANGLQAILSGQQVADTQVAAQVQIATLQQQVAISQSQAQAAIAEASIQGQVEQTQAQASTTNAALGVIAKILSGGGYTVPPPITQGVGGNLGPAEVVSVATPPPVAANPLPKDTTITSPLVAPPPVAVASSQPASEVPVFAGAYAGTHPLLTIPGSAPGGTPMGYSEIVGQNYFNNPNAPYITDYTYPNESAAINAGALIFDPTSGRYVPAVSGAQITY